MVLGPSGNNLCEFLHNLQNPFGLWIGFGTKPHDGDCVCNRLQIGVGAVQGRKLVHEYDEARREEEVAVQLACYGRPATKTEDLHDEWIPPWQIPSLPGALEQMNRLI